MPISSGATGRVAPGIDTAIAWSPDGGTKETQRCNRSHDSYLKRYLESTQRLRQGSDGTGDASPPHHAEDDGITEKSQGSDNESEEKPPSDKSLRKSKTCTLL
ncbi:unnamed protein product [Boreogadus saida]